MYLREVSGRGHRTQEPYGSAFDALPLRYVHENLFIVSVDIA